MPSRHHRYNTRRSNNGRSPSQGSNSSHRSSNASRGSNASRSNTPRSNTSRGSNSNLTPDSALSSNRPRSNSSQGSNAPRVNRIPQAPNSRYRGPRVRFCSGKYKGKYGWINDARGDRGLAGTTQWHVIVQERDGSRTYPERPIWRSSWEYYDWANPTNSLDQFLFENRFTVWVKVKELNDHLDVIGGLPSNSDAEARRKFEEFCGFFIKHF